MTSSMIQSIVKHLHEIDRDQFLHISDHVLDLFTLSVQQIAKGKSHLSRHRVLTFLRVKRFIAEHIGDHQLSAPAIAEGTGLSVRYINSLFSDEETSVMRFVTQQRLEKCRRQIANRHNSTMLVSEIAMQWGFINMAHFSRAFKQRYGISPRDYRAKDQSG